MYSKVAEGRELMFSLETDDLTTVYIDRHRKSGEFKPVLRSAETHLSLKLQIHSSKPKVESPVQSVELDDGAGGKHTCGQRWS